MKTQKILISILSLILVCSIYYNYKFNNEIKENENTISDLEGRQKELVSQNTKLNNEKKELENLLEHISSSYSNSLSNNTYSYPQSENEIVVPNASISSSNRGTAIVVFKPNSSCSYFILENNSGYILAEWMGGNDPSVGDKITGNFHSYGTKDFYNQSNDRSSRLWIDDFMLSKDRAIEKIRDKCD